MAFTGTSPVLISTGVLTCFFSSLGKFTSRQPGGPLLPRGHHIVGQLSTDTQLAQVIFLPQLPVAGTTVCTARPCYSLFLNSNPSGILIHSYLWSTYYRLGTRVRMERRHDPCHNMIPAIRNLGRRQINGQLQYFNKYLGRGCASGMVAGTSNPNLTMGKASPDGTFSLHTEG